MMRLITILLFIGTAVLGFGFGFGWWAGGSVHKSKARIASGIHPEREATSNEWKSFAVVLYAHNDAAWCERSLRSIFEQDYEFFRLVLIDDGSIDDTLERAKEFIIANQQQHRVIIMQNETPCGLGASLRRATNQCLDREIVVPISAKNWMASPSVLLHWNKAFRNPDVWIALGKSISYPSYDFFEPPVIDHGQVAKKGWGNWLESTSHCFYAALFKQISSQNLHDDYLLSLLELSGGRVKNVLEPVCFVNDTQK